MFISTPEFLITESILLEGNKSLRLNFVDSLTLATIES